MKNPHYYDQEKVTIERVKLAYVDGSDQDMTSQFRKRNTHLPVSAN